MTSTAAAAVLVMSSFSVAATHDYLAWNRVRWDLGRRLLAEGVDSLNVAGGFEFNAWHNYDKFRARGNVGKVYYWWYDRRDYLIAMHVPEGYGILRTAQFHSWVHRRAVPIHVAVKR